MLIILALPVAHDPELEHVPDGSQLPDDRALGPDVATARSAFSRLGWRAGIYTSGRGYIVLLLSHPAGDAAEAALTLAAAYDDGDAVRAMQFNGVDTDSFAVVSGSDPADIFNDERTRHLHQVLGMDVCVRIDEMVMDDLLDGGEEMGVAADVAALLRKSTMPEPPVPEPDPVRSLGDTLFG